ncbi:hypothetical protein FHETE_4774 [Fusarium heterosporum]|uniref:BZIP domain-containing protein n=1 Tax=Fusarium heterosporum TaxID=42747 RepID=A0A8H5TFA7_FUSHE|nr:hypothetical protein FHETE_4774 [Fusarium heterosporum]
MSPAKSSNYLGDMNNEASKSRRERNREAQQQFRKRRQAAEAARLQRLKKLEGIIEKMSTVVVSYADKMLREDVLKQYPALAADAQDVIANVLALANEAGDHEERSAAEHIDVATPNYAEEDQNRHSDDQNTSSDIPTITLHPSQHSAEFIAEHSPPYSHYIALPSISYGDSIFQASHPQSSAIPTLLGQIPWNTNSQLAHISRTPSYSL